MTTDDERTLQELGYAQELSRGMSGFSNLALSMSIICILAGGITSLHIGICSVGGAAVGIGWPLVSLFSLCVAATMAQIASAFPTAGGLYHWAALLGGRGWGWGTAWFNLVGLITVLAAINVGTFQFVAGAFAPQLAQNFGLQCGCVALITVSHALLNHLGIRITTWLTDISGYWILITAAALTITLLAGASSWDWSRLITFSNFSGLPVDGAVWPKTESTAWLFALGFLLPAYTITGFDASAHVSEETVEASRHVPRGIVQSVLVSGTAGWIMLCAFVLAIPDMNTAAEQGTQMFFSTLRAVTSPLVANLLLAAIAIAQYFCGLATVTSASRMAYAFARDGGLPASRHVRSVSPRFKTPAVAIWCVSIAAVSFTLYAKVYETITAVCVIFLYISYVLPSAIGGVVFGKRWTKLGPWQLGVWFRPLAIVSVCGCIALIVIGLQPPNDKAVWVVTATAALLALLWVSIMRHHFRGPPCNLESLQRGKE